MINDATNKILMAIERTREQAKEAGNDFDITAENIQQMAGRSINLFGGTAVSQVADIVAESKKACDTLYASYQALIISLDRICRPLVEDNADPEEFVKAQGLDKKFDSSAIDSVIDKVIAENEKAVADFKGGKEKALMALFGACMKELRGAGDPAVIKELLEKKLKA